MTTTSRGSFDWGGGQWGEMMWVRNSTYSGDESTRVIVGYDGYRRSYFAAVYLLSSPEESSLMWAVGTDPGDEITDISSFERACDSWQEFERHTGAIDWASEADLLDALLDAPGQADFLRLRQRWYRRSHPDGSESRARALQEDDLLTLGLEGAVPTQQVILYEWRTAVGDWPQSSRISRDSLRDWEPITEGQAVQDLSYMGLSESSVRNFVEARPRSTPTPVLIQVLALADDRPIEDSGSYIAQFIPPAGEITRENWHGRVLLTFDPHEALAFDTEVEAHSFWRQQSGVRPWDGLPNRPLTAFNVTYIPLDAALDADEVV